MESVNTILPIGTDFHEVFDYVTKGTPVCLYTYETCNACYSPIAPLYIRDEISTSYNYALVKQVVTEVYGYGKMDNKITLKYYVNYDIAENGDLLKTPVYITCWDGRISISTDVYFFRDITGANSYRVVPPYREEFEWYRGHDGRLYEDFEQSIGE